MPRSNYHRDPGGLGLFLSSIDIRQIPSFKDGEGPGFWAPPWPYLSSGSSLRFRPSLFKHVLLLASRSIEAMRPLRPLLPSAVRPRNEPLPPLPRDRVASACDQCRARKIKCNGERPVCIECVKRSTSCHYATRSSETQGQALKRKYDALEAENEAYVELFKLIRTSSDSESYELLRRVRKGHDVEDVLREIKEADLLIQLNPKPATRVQITLPSLASIIPKRMSMPDHPYFALATTSQVSSNTGHRSPPDNPAAQYPSPPA